MFGRRTAVICRIPPLAGLALLVGTVSGFVLGGQHTGWRGFVVFVWIFGVPFILMSIGLGMMRRWVGLGIVILALFDVGALFAGAWSPQYYGDWPATIYNIPSSSVFSVD